MHERLLFCRYSFGVEIERFYYFLFLYRTYITIMDGRKRSDVKPGMLVNIVQKHHQQTGELTEGVVRQLLTNSSTHPHGIKVRLETGEVGRVKEILEE